MHKRIRIAVTLLVFLTLVAIGTFHFGRWLFDHADQNPDVTTIGTSSEDNFFEEDASCSVQANLLYQRYSEEYNSPQTAVLMPQMHFNKSKSRCLAYLIRETHYQRDGSIRELHEIVDVLAGKAILVSDYVTECTNNSCLDRPIQSARADIDRTYPTNILVEDFLNQATILLRE